MMNTLIGGGLVLLGVVVTQLFSFWTARSDRKERRERLLREKYEELARSILDTGEEIHQMTSLSQVADIANHLLTPSAHKACMLALIYFPDLVRPTAEYTKAIVLYHRFLLRGFDWSAPASLVAQALHDPDHPNHVKMVLAAKDKVIEQIEQLAPKYTQA